MTPLEAWRALSLRRPALVHAELVQRKKHKAEVWRLSDGQRYHRVVAKRCRLQEAAREELVYCEVLPGIGMDAGQYLGRVETGDGRTAWLFLREVVGDDYVAEQPLHRALAAEWLSMFHAATRAGRAFEGLPDVGPSRYRTMLEDLVQSLPAVVRNRELGVEDVKVIAEATVCCRDLLELWFSIERSVAPLPRTVVHGSFSRRNMLVTATANGAMLRVFDWAAAGWGVPARDLAKLFGPTIAGTFATYWRNFPDVEPSGRVLLVAVGRLFRAVEHMSWVAPKLTYPSTAEPMRRTAAHTAELVSMRATIRRLI